DLTVVTAAGDTLLAIALASTLFFAVPTHAARGRVALYLLTTVAPFAVVAPVVGPILDRFASGRRIALAVTLLARAALVWVLAGHAGGLALYPLALGTLIASRGFTIARSAVVPRVLPPGSTLVRVNSRLQLASTLTGFVVGVIGVGISELAGYRWVLRLDSPVYLAAIAITLTLPPHVDSAAGEERARGLGSAVVAGDLGERFTERLLPSGPRGRQLGLGNVPAALRGVLPLRCLAGFLTLFLAFLLRSGHHGTPALAALAACAVAGSGLGLLIGFRLSGRRPEALITGALLIAGGGCVVAAVTYSLPVGLLLALLATLTYTASKLGLDAIIQRDVAEVVRVSTFARSETAVQLSWVAGGAIGLAPMSGRLGFALAAGFMLAAVLAERAGLSRRHLRRAVAAVSGGDRLRQRSRK
ncbi:MAG: MFS transporter, partial [Mycobacteriales bacterium]